MRGGLRHQPEARVTILLTNPAKFSEKELVRFTAFQQVTSSLSLNGIGSATVAFPNKNLTFFKGIQRPDRMRTASDEIERLKQAWSKFSDESSAADLRVPAEYAELEPEQILLPRVSPFDFAYSVVSLSTAADA